MKSCKCMKSCKFKKQNFSSVAIKTCSCYIQNMKHYNVALGKALIGEYNSQKLRGWPSIKI